MVYNRRMDVLTYESERGYIDFKPFTYSRSFSDSTKWGQNVAEADLTRLYFYVKTSESAASPFISLSSASSSQIEWLSGGGIRVKLGTNTGSHAGDNNEYELRAKMTDGSYLTVARGRLHIKESIVDTP